MTYEWFFNDKDFNRAQKSTVEDDIFGNICFKQKDDKYLVDIHKEYYNSREHGYDLEVYTENDDGTHGIWLGSIHSIKSAKTLQRFKTRAERLLKEFMIKAKDIVPSKECIRMD